MSETFQGSQDYVASEELMRAVNIAMVLQKPLLIKGEPGTGKTVLAEAIAKIPGQRADHLEYQVHHQGPGRSVGLRCGPAAV